MVDLGTQYARIKPKVDEAIQKVIDSADFINGSAVNKFAENLSNYVYCNHVIPCANGTDALQIALMACGLKRGDEVIVPAFSFVATAEVVALLGLRPVFVDVNEITFNIDVSKIEAAITPRTRAIIPVHLYGQMADMETIMMIAKKHDLFVIEDAAQAIGAKILTPRGIMLSAGATGTFGCTSFFPTKNLGAFGDGGAIFTNDPELAKKAKTIANHGSSEKYYNDIIGINSRLDTIQAAILDVKLGELNKYSYSQQFSASDYNDALRGIDGVLVPERAPDMVHVYNQYTIKVLDNRRNELKRFLAESGIPTMIYYPVPLHKQKAFSDYAVKGQFDVAEKLAKSVLSLPMHSELNVYQIRYIADRITKFFW